MREMKVLAIGAAWLLFALSSAQSQDDRPNDAGPEDTEAPAAEVDTDADTEVLESDDDSYRDIDDEDFRPSEEIPADQSIAFPTDI